MKFLVYLVLILLSVQIQGFDVLYPREDEVIGRPFQIFKVDADMSVEEKWEMVFAAKNNKSLFKEFIDIFVDYVYEQELIPLQFSDNIIPLFNRYGQLHPDMQEEIRILSKVSGVDLEKIIILNFTYEMFAHVDACTSIVIRKQNGEVFLGRNLDYFFENYYTNLSIQLNYYDEQEQKDYTVSSFVGYVISVNGVKHGKYSISFNQRSLGHKQDNFEAFMRGAFSNEYLIRETLRTKTNYKDATAALQNEYIIGSCYYIIAGTKNNEGMVIERDREGTYKSYVLSNETWFLVATNYDNDEEDGDGRKTAAIQNIQKIGQQNMDEIVLLEKVLSQYPVFHTLTISSTVMNAKNQQMNETVWY